MREENKTEQRRDKNSDASHRARNAADRRDKNNDAGSRVRNAADRRGNYKILSSILMAITVFAAVMLMLILLTYSGVDIPVISGALNPSADRNDAGAQDASATGAGANDADLVSNNASNNASNGAQGNSGIMSNAAQNATATGQANDPAAVTGVDLSNVAADIRVPALSLTYDLSEGTEFLLHGEYIAECSRDSFYLLAKDGAEVYRRNVDFNRPALYKRGDYLLVSDYGGRSAFVMKGAKPVWEDSFTSGIVNASINNNGYISFVLDAVGYRNSVRVMAPIGKTLFDWVVADDYVIGAEIAPSGKGLVINRMKTAGINASSGLEFLDMQSEPYKTINSGAEEVFLGARYLENNTLAVVSENTFRLFSEQGEQLIKDKYDAVAAMCEFPRNSAAVAASRGNASLVMCYDAKTLKDRILYTSDQPILNLSADNGYLFINHGKEAVVLKENGKLASYLALESDAQYGGASEKLGVLVVTKKYADVYAF